ncbi:MAG: hypothetical protein L0177_18850 [Chloroflexi bacterium]|nr:hypothetical protein [Chloroflexota bacterium]
MNITNVSASVRYSRALGRGRHKTVELSAAADLEPQEDWHSAQAELYRQLGQQLKTLWIAESNVQSVKQEVAAKDISDEHYCYQHKTPFQRYEKNDQVWYAHKSEDRWCREK